MIRLFGYECRRIFASGISRILLVIFSLLIGICWFFEVDSSKKAYGSESTTGFYDKNGHLLSSFDLIRKEDEIRQKLAGKMDEAWLENYEKQKENSYKESLSSIYDFDALNAEYSESWLSDYLSHSDEWAEPLFFYSDGSDEEEAVIQEEIRKEYEKENAGKKKLIYRKDYEQKLETGKPLETLEYSVLSNDWFNYVSQAAVEKIWANPDGLIPGEYMYDGAGRKEAMGAWPNTRLSREQISYYGELLSRQDCFYYGKRGTAAEIFNIWHLSGLFLLFLSVWYGSRALSMDQSPAAAETLACNVREKNLPWIKAAAILTGTGLAWGLLYGVPIVLSLITDTFPDLKMNMMAITNLANIFTIGQGMLLTCGQSLIGALASCALAFLIGSFFRSAAASAAVSLLFLFLIPEIFVSGMTGIGLILPGCLLYMPAMFDWSAEIFHHVILLWPVYLIWWLIWIPLIFLLAIWIRKRKRESFCTGS